MIRADQKAHTFVTANEGIRLQHCYLAVSIDSDFINRDLPSSPHEQPAVIEQKIALLQQAFNEAMRQKLMNKDSSTGESLGRIMHTKVYHRSPPADNSAATEQHAQIRCYFAITASMAGFVPDDWKQLAKSSLPEGAIKGEPTFVQMIPMVRQEISTQQLAQ